MEFKKDADVYAANDDHLGQVERVVLDPLTKEVTHIVVRKGIFFTEDKVIPVEMIASATKDYVNLRQNIDWQNLPDFEEVHYVIVNEEELARSTYIPSVYGYPPVLPLGGYPAAGYPPVGYPDYVEPGYVTETEQNIPEGTVALKEGAKVMAADDKHVGNIEELLTDSRTGRVTHFVISQGLLLKERKLVPSTWISRVYEDEVDLAVRSRTLDELQPYESLVQETSH